MLSLEEKLEKVLMVTVPLVPSAWFLKRGEVENEYKHM